ncbi:MAG: FAD-dependent monooxygenase [Acidobacteriaceae bacterium]|nr:FAD-dependent monooxygenase [Acidobacteriaceae bacterium]
MRVVIVGAGIGGLAAAVALRRVGVESLVIERAAQIAEVGAGLSLWSNAMNALHELGLDDKVRGAGSVVERLVSQTVTGRHIGVIDLSEITRRAGAPNVCVHRAALQQILLEELPSSAVQAGARCIGFEGSAAVLEGGRHIEGDIVVGADGIFSVIRDQLHGPAEPRYAGYTCWRGIFHGEGVIPDRTSLLAVGRGSQFGLWPCGPGQFYWFLTKNSSLRNSKVDASSQAVATCDRWPSPIPEIVARTSASSIIQNDIIDRPPLSWWGRGPVTLLGDAAHATTPNLGQGACQALEDAIVLADCLRQQPQPSKRPCASTSNAASRVRRRSCAIPGKAADCCNSIIHFSKRSGTGSWGAGSRST